MCEAAWSRAKRGVLGACKFFSETETVLCPEDNGESLKVCKYKNDLARFTL